MKKLFTVLAFTIISAVAFAQAHTYNICCRYTKKTVTGDCACPGCLKEDDDEIKAQEVESRQRQAKAEQEYAEKKAAFQKEDQEQNRIREEREKRNSGVYIACLLYTSPSPRD